MTATAPNRTEASEYYFTYIDQVVGTDICATLAAQLADTIELLGAISERQSLARYAADKWSIREIVGHVNDAERLFVSRAFWFARGFDPPLPSFDQEVAVAAARSDQRPLASHLEEFRSIRAGTLTFFRGLPSDAWERRGIASGYPFTVRAIAFVVAGHATHHWKVIRERYL